MSELVERIDALLPQTQCQRCGYPACRPYAEAVAAGSADFNQCPPGGDAGIAALAALLGRAPKAMNPANGVPLVQAQVAVIDETVCIGCTKCIQACPVDAIVGAAQLMHTVIAAECNGCELCLPPCPVDCITLVPAATRALAPPAQYRTRYQARERRLQAQEAAQREEREQRKQQLRARATSSDPSEAPRALDPVARALAAARNKTPPRS
ncbi:MAG TPA: RnfABCDGE type electron transport complex subunit B [Solimonas sp.]|nr:RnfABCDGE type electron transport complex subunit B [Solimonas sp.]